MSKRESEEMEEKNNRYERSKIYKLVDTLNHKYYIGATCGQLCKRLSWHKSASKEPKRKDQKVYKYFNEIGWDNVKIVLVQEYLLENKEQLLREEDNFIRSCLSDPDCLNSFRAILTDDERNEKDKIRHKVYYENNRETELKRGKNYYFKNAEAIRLKHHNYLIEHIDQRHQYWDEYYKKNKAEILQKNKLHNAKKYNCGCGSTIRNDSKYDHEKTIKHQEWLKSQNNTER